MSPAALALAIGLHGAVAAALWWAAPTHRFDHAETPIMVSIEPQPASAGTAAAPTSPMSVASPAAEAIPTESAQTEAKRVEPAPPEAETPEPPQQAALAYARNRLRMLKAEEQQVEESHHFAMWPLTSLTSGLHQAGQLV